MPPRFAVVDSDQFLDHMVMKRVVKLRLELPFEVSKNVADAVISAVARMGAIGEENAESPVGPKKESEIFQGEGW